jgi:thiamine-monophosphate kinase
MSKGENALVDWLRHRFPADPDRVPIGIGDDMACVHLDGNLVLMTADMLLDGVHFDTRQHIYELIGRKAIACSLSDCAAMACRPRVATISLALHDGMSMEDVQRLYEGMACIAEEFDCAIIGGDTTSWPGKLAIDVCMLAEPMTSRGAIRRCDARIGDTIYVSGPLGGSIAGKHLTFTPRLELASRLVLDPNLHAMMDLSDGLSMDLHRLCTASGCDAELSAEAIDEVTSQAARALSDEDGISPTDHALNDGEDFELLIVGEEGMTTTEELGLVRVGRMVSPSQEGRATICLSDEQGRFRVVEPRGYEHFR